MSAEHGSLIERFADSQSTHPMARKVLADRTLYRAHASYGDIDARFMANMVPKIADFGLARRGDGRGPLLHPIQPNLFRAPEVLLGTGWSYSADVWNFGTMVGGHACAAARRQTYADLAPSRCGSSSAKERSSASGSTTRTAAPRRTAPRCTSPR